MALKLNERYPGRFDNPSSQYPQGSFKNRSAPGVLDGSYLEKDWANDKEGFFQSLLVMSGISANGQVDSVGASQYYQALAQIISNSSPTYPGEIAMFGRDTAPDGWLKANGAAVSRTTYSALFSAIGTRFGSGNGSTTFNIPDLRGEFIRCWDDGKGVDPGRGLASFQRGSLIVHDLNAGIGCQTARASTSGQDNAASFGADTVSTSDYPGISEAGVSATGSALGTNTVIGSTRPRNVSLLACIKF